MSPSKKSWVWKYAIVTVENNVKCNICGDELFYGGSTSTISKHLNRKHQLFHSNAEEEDSGDSTLLEESEVDTSGASSSTTPRPASSRISTPATSTAPTNSSVNDPGAASARKRKRSATDPSHQECSSSRQETITRALATMVVTNNLPLSFAHSKGFVDFMKVIEPGYKVPHHEAIIARLNLGYDVVKKNIEAPLEKTTSVSLTTDEWSSLAQDAYLSATIHYIDPKWNLLCHTLSTLPIEDRPNTENLSTALEVIRGDWSIEGNVFAVVHDNASVMNATVRLMDSVKYSINCAAHTLQLCINDALRAVSDFKNVCNSAGKVVAHFKHSNVATQALSRKQLQLGLKKERFAQSCPTRWDSVYMCDTLFRNRTAVCAVVAVRYLTSSATALRLEITEQEWRTLEDMVKVLKPLQITTKIFSSENKVTLSAVRPVVYSLRENHYEDVHIDHYEDIDSVSEFKSFIKAALCKRFKINIPVADEVLPEQIASFLDPRYKDLRCEGNAEANEIRACVKIIITTGPAEDGRPERAEDHVDSYLDFIFAPQKRNLDGVTQFDQYLSEPQISHQLDPLKWWKTRENLFPAVAALARKYLATPASSASSGRVFSSAGNIVTYKRSCISPKNVNLLVFLHKNQSMFLSDSSPLRSEFV